MLPSLGLLVMIGLLIHGPIPQNPSYHHFADNRIMTEKRLKIICAIIFTGFLLLTVGSGYYHLHPNNYSLVYDRIPISIIQMSLFSFIIYDRVHPQKGYKALFVLNIVGVLSVIYWILTEQAGKGDLRPYAMVQFFPLIAIPLLLWMYKSSSHYTRTIVWMFLFFGLAKLAETYDNEIYLLLNNTISGHTFKHLLMTAAGYEIVVLFKNFQKEKPAFK